MCNPNLLINTDFTNPVNQRGQTAYSNAGYCIDMWNNVTNNTVVTVTSSGIRIQNIGTEMSWFTQRTEIKPAYLQKSYTASCKIDYVDYTYSQNAKTLYVQITEFVAIGVDLSEEYVFLTFAVNPGADFTIQSVKLELGTVSTLANEVVDYKAELRKCQRYYVKSAVNTTYMGIGLGMPTTIPTNTAARVIVTMPNVMRKNPTVIAHNLYLMFDDATTIKVLGILWTAMDIPGTCRIALETEAKMPTSRSFILTSYTSANGYLEVSAEL